MDEVSGKNKMYTQNITYIIYILFERISQKSKKIFSYKFM